MRIDLFNSRIFLGWVMVWLFIANVPTEGPSVTFSNAVRLSAWTMIWMPVLVIRGITLQRRATFITLCGAIYIVVLNITQFNVVATLVIANLASALIVSSVYLKSQSTQTLLRAIDVVLVLWASLLLIQVAANFSTGAVLDFHSLFFPFSEMRYGFAGGGIYRLTGPHIEPGTYCAWVYGLVLLRMLLGGRVMTLSTGLAMATMPLTLSAWGMIATVIYLVSSMIALFYRREFAWSASSLALLVVLVSLFYGDDTANLQKYILGRSQLLDDSGQSKEWAYFDVYSNIFEYLIFGKNFTYNFCVDCISPQDAGIALNLSVYLGLIISLSIFLVIFAAAFLRGGAALAVMTLPLPFAKYYIWETVFWVIVFVALNVLWTCERRGCAATFTVRALR